MKGVSVNMKNTKASSAWESAWNTVAVTPFSRSSPAAPARPAGPSITALLISATPKVNKTSKCTELQVCIQENVTIGTSTFGRGDVMKITIWQETLPVMAMQLDLVRLIDCYASPDKKQPGHFYYNCRNIQLVTQSADFNDAFLARQSLEKMFVITSHTIVCDHTIIAHGIRSQVVWPNDVSYVNKEGEEKIRLNFAVQYLKWTAEQVRNNSPPTAQQFEFTLWRNHVDQMLLGDSLSIEDIKALMSNGANPIAFTILCSIDNDPKYKPTFPGAKQLKVHAFVPHLAGYLSTCPIVSRQLVQQYVQKGEPKAAVGEQPIINVTTAGLANAGAFPQFRAMTSSPDTLTDEDSIRDALESDTAGTVIFFALSGLDDKGKDEGKGKEEEEEEPETKKTKKSRN
jgi:hypothetical protein